MARLADFTTDTYNGIAPTCVRSTGGYAETVAGQLVWFIADDARITDKGLLVEPAATNQFLWSQSLEQSYWRGAGAGNTSQTDYITAPDGTVTAEDITNAGSLAQLGNSGFGIAPSTQTVTISGFFRRDPAFPSQQPYVQVNHSNGGLKASVQPFNANTPAPSSPYDLIPTVPFAGATITAMANGWHRFAAMVTVNPAGTVEAYLGHAIGTGDRSTGQPSDAYFWGFQFEAGAKATSYFPTTSGVGTRAADQVSFTIPAGVTTLTFTFDDGSTQDKTVTPGATYTVPTDLNRAYIKYIDGAGAAGPTYTLTATSAGVTVTATSVALKRARRLAATTRAVTVAATAAKLLRARKLMASTAPVAVAAQAVLLKRSSRLVAATVPMAATANAASLVQQRRLAGTTTAVASTVTPAYLSWSRRLVGQPLAVTVTANPVSLSRGGAGQLVAMPVTVTVTSGSVRMVLSRRIAAPSAPIAVVANPHRLMTTRRLTAALAPVTVGAQAVSLRRSRLLQASPGSVTINAAPANFRLALRLSALASTVVVVPSVALLTKLGGVVLPTPPGRTAYGAGFPRLIRGAAISRTIRGTV